MSKVLLKVKVLSLLFSVVSAPLAKETGMCRPSGGLLVLDDTRAHAKDALVETLLHELLHAMWDQTALRASEQMADYEEAVISGLSPILLDTLQRNPKLVAVLLGQAELGE